MKKAILFDLDGTLWDSTKGVLKAWNEIIAKHPEAKRGIITLDELSGYLGLPMDEIANRMFEHSTQEEKCCIMNECCACENEYLRVHGGSLYPDLELTLEQLKTNYMLFVVSNCQKGYIESFLTAHKLEKLFDDKICWGDNELPKGENNKLIMKKHGIEQAVYVGDTAGDEESARVADIPFIFASYGFGKAKEPDYTIKALAELPELMNQIEKL